jgi:hypothetical protein
MRKKKVSFCLDKQGETVYAYFYTFGEYIQPFQKITVVVFAQRRYVSRVNFTPSTFLGEINDFIVVDINETPKVRN